MAVAFDAAGPSSSGQVSATSPVAFTHTAGAGGSVVFGVLDLSTASQAFGSSTATYAGSAMTALASQEADGTGANNGGLFTWGLTGQAPGANSVSMAHTGTVSDRLVGATLSFAGASGFGTPAAAHSSGATGTGTITVPSTTAGGLVAVAVVNGAGGLSWTGPGGQTAQVTNAPPDGNSGAGNLYVITVPSTGGSMTFTWTQTSDLYGAVAVEVLPAAGGAAPAPMAPAWTRPWRPALARKFGPAVPFLLPPLASPLPPAAGVATLQGAGSLGTAAVQGAAATLSGAGSLTASTGPPCITGLGGTGAGYFADAGGNPRMVLGDAAWALPGNAGRWNSGNWQADFDGYLATRAGQGFTVVYCKPIGTTQSGNLDDFGKTFDSLYPFQGGTPSTGVSGANPSSGLTAAFWARIDYFLNSALAKGITIFLNAIGYASDFDSGPGPLAGKSSSEFQAYGAALGARYASQPNLIWMVADDYFGSTDAKISAFLTGLRGAGDSHPISIENYPESTSRQDLPAGTALSWGTSNAQFNFCYSYNVTYYGVEKAYLEASPVPVIQGDGYFYQGGNSGTYQGGTGAFAYDRAMRQDAWHAVSSGARGWISGSEGIWQYQSNALADSALEWWYVNGAGAIRAFTESLPGWHQLVPDTSSVLVTGGRGTHASSLASGGGGGQYEVAFTDSYVTASRTPDSGSGSSLALIYLSHGTTITIDQSKMVSGYTATWVDPVTLATSAATAGSTYNSSAKGSNSAGEADWVLVLQAPVAATIQGTATLAGAGSLSTAAAQQATAALSGTASLALAAAQGSGGTLSGQGSIAAPDITQGAPATLGAHGSLSTAAVQQATAALAGTGSITGSSTGTGSGSGTLSGAGSIGPAVTQLAPAALSGTGSLGTAATQRAIATLAGTGSLTGQSGAFSSGTATLAATGSLTASGLVSGGGSAALNGAGGIAAAARIAAPAALAGAGVIATAAAIRSPAALAGTGTLAAAGASHGPVVYGTVTAGTMAVARAAAGAAQAAHVEAGQMTLAHAEGGQW